MGKLTGRVAFITGASRGQGRSHALALAREGADIIAIDINEQIDTVPYPLARTTDLNETVRLVQDTGSRILAQQTDVRDYDAVEDAVQKGLAEFGHIDIVCANAGIASFASAWEMSPAVWSDMVSTHLDGAWFTIRACLPSMVERRAGGSIVITSSIYGLTAASGNIAHYTAAMHGKVGLMRALAAELGPHSIRVNTVNPTYVDTDMIQNDSLYRMFLPDRTDPQKADFLDVIRQSHSLPVSALDVSDVSNAVVWLASDESRYVTGTTLVIDAGAIHKHV